ncbi:hypothetical protein RFI_00801, partial [Reticulomyxa filosa]
VEMVVSGMKLVFLNRFMEEVSTWMTNSKLLLVPSLFTTSIANSKYRDYLYETEKIAVDAIEENLEQVSLISNEESKPTKNAIPKIDIVITDLVLEVPKATTSKERLIGTLGKLHIANDLPKEDSLNIQVQDLVMSILFGDNETLGPLFHQSKISVCLKEEFSDISLMIGDLDLDISKKRI